jgi:glutathione S-transferase
VVLFCAEEEIDYEAIIVDLMSGEHKQPAYLAHNPRGQVPFLEDDGFGLCESSAILKYLADKFDSPAYPEDLQQRARVNERMDWINTDVYRELGYHLAYPQVLPHHIRESEAVQVATIEWGKQKAEEILAIFDTHAIGDRPYVCGDAMTIADYFAAQVMHVGTLIGCNYEAYPNIQRWLDTMRALPNWKQVNAAFDGFAAAMAGKSFVNIGDR